MEDDYFLHRQYPSVKILNRQISAPQYRALKFIVAFSLMINILNIAFGYAYFQKFTEHQVMSESRQRLAQYDDISLQLATEFSEADKKIEIVDKTLQEKWAALLRVSDEMEKMRQRAEKYEILSSQISKNISDNVDKQALNLTKRIEALEASNNCRWVESFGRKIPPGAIVAGKDKYGFELYVARKRHDGALIPGIFVPSQATAYIMWKGRQTAYDECQILCNCTSRWLPMNGGEIPAGVFVAGETWKGQPLYVGRATHNGFLIPGRVEVSGNDYRPVCYIAFDGEEIAKSNFEIMVF